jgi:predicted DNA-binding transcriptional regulator AlpA
MRRFPDDYPDVMRLKDLSELFGLSLKRIYDLNSQGAFTHLVIKPALGHPRFDRARVEEYIRTTRRGLSLKKAS